MRLEQTLASERPSPTYRSAAGEFIPNSASWGGLFPSRPAN